MTASVEDMRHQMQFKIGLVRSLGAVAQASQDRWADYISARGPRKTTSRSGSGISPTTQAQKPSKELKVKEFDGSEKDFRDFLEDSRAYFEIVKPELSDSSNGLSSSRASWTW